MNQKKEIWIETGYGECARIGPQNLTIDGLAEMMSRSRSSFYHLFGSVEKYKVDLLEHHWQESLIVAEQLEKANSFYPDFAYLLSEHKNWTFFHIQMYHNRDRDPRYNDMFDNVTSMIENKVGSLWAKLVELDDLPIEKTKHLYRVIRETMFTKMSYDNFSPELLDQEIKKLNKSLQFLFTGVSS